MNTTKSAAIHLNLWTLLAVLVLALTAFTRFYDLGARVMSHDEVNHAIPAYNLSQGNGYRYDPVIHGPLQFHLIALSYFLLGDSDFTSRVPAGLFSTAAVAIALFAFRRYLSKAGALAAGALLLISPVMLFFGRYVRSEPFIVVWGLLVLYAVLRYLETGETWALWLFTLANALHFTDKATAYIYAAQELLILLAFGLASTRNRLRRRPAALDSEDSRPEAETQTIQRRNFWEMLRQERSFDLLVLLGTLILPLLAALPLRALGFDPLDGSSAGTWRAAAAVAVLGIAGAAAGIRWFGARWLKQAALFYAIFATLYTTFFTNLAGIGGGLMGTLGYWLTQQSVGRGGQPWYYYIFLMIPVYEFLPAVGALLAVGTGARKRLWRSKPGKPFEAPENTNVEVENEGSDRPVPVLALLACWSVTNLIAFSLSGEKMPWLTTNIALPLILLAGWAVGYLIHEVDWAHFFQRRGWLGVLLLGLAPFAAAGAWQTVTNLRLSYPLGNASSLPHALVGVVFYLAVACLAVWGGARFLRGLPAGRILTLAIMAVLAVLTARTAIRAAFILYDYPYEYLAYAHSAPDPKRVLKQIENLSRQTTGGLDLVVAYDGPSHYPFWWYLRHYPNKIDLGQNPDADLSQADVILAGEENYAQVDARAGDAYQVNEFMRLWWPNQDYMNLNLAPFFTDPRARSAVWQIWFNRDYSEYARLRGSPNFDAAHWQPSTRMRIYIRKNVIQWAGVGKTLIDP